MFQHLPWCHFLTDYIMFRLVLFVQRLLMCMSHGGSVSQCVHNVAATSCSLWTPTRTRRYETGNRGHTHYLLELSWGSIQTQFFLFALLLPVALPQVLTDFGFFLNMFLMLYLSCLCYCFVCQVWLVGCGSRDVSKSCRSNTVHVLVVFSGAYISVLRCSDGSEPLCRFALCSV